MRRLLFLIAFLVSTMAFARNAIIIGSKPFTESYLLAELAAQTLEKEGYQVERKFGLGGTGLLFQAVEKGEMDLYFEYTGTIREAILRDPNLKSLDAVSRRLRDKGMAVSKPMGFANNYALAVRREWAESNDVKTISEVFKLKSKPVGGFSHEFSTRADGITALERHYGGRLTANRQPMEHSLAYTALENKRIDVMDVYTTDAKISRLDLVILEDDKNFFIEYEALILASQNFVNQNPEAWEILKSFEGTISESQMQELNAQVDIERKSFAETIANHLGRTITKRAIPTARVWLRTKEHLVLVGLSLFAALIIGVPLGIVAAGRPHFGQGIILLSSLFQTIPSLALLCFLIPLFGIGTWPALVALFLYSLLPIVVGTTVGLRSVDPKLLEVSHVLGVRGFRRLFKIQIPLAAAPILSGIRTAAIISIGTATLAALIGAGGYGVPIVTGLAISDNKTVLLGAIPAAIMAVVVHLMFEVFEKIFIPKGLRSRS